MKPSKTNHQQGRLFEQRLSDQLNPKNELHVLADIINWKALEDEFKSMFVGDAGAPAKPVRLMVGMILLQQMYGLSDESVVYQWVENPYWQLFCGFDYLQWKFPAHPTTLGKWRKRLGENGIGKIHTILIQTAIQSGAIKKTSLEKVIVDTTVMPKAITFPTDSKLYLKGIQKLVSFAKGNGINLRQSYKRVALRVSRRIGKYQHSRQYKKARKEINRLRTYLGRLLREVMREIDNDLVLKKRAAAPVTLMGKIYLQQKEDKNKVYSVHEPTVECISKGKSHKKYEFGCKAAIVVTHKENFVLSSKALHGTPYDGHTLKESLKVSEEASGVKIKEAFVDRGYRGHGVKEVKVEMARNMKKMHWRKRKELGRRQAIEPIIGHMKSDGKMGLNYLKGKIGDKINACLSGVGQNMRYLVNFLRSARYCPVPSG